MAKIRAIIKRWDEEYGHMTNVSNTLKNLQNIVEGYIETITLRENPDSDPIVIICNEEGLISNLQYNCTIAGYQLFGDIVVVGVDGDEFGDLPIDFKTWKEVWLGGGK